MNNWLTYITLLLCLPVSGQLDSARVQLSHSLSSAEDEIACCLVNGQLLAMHSAPVSQWFNDQNTNTAQQFDLYFTSDSCALYSTINSSALNTSKDEGTACFGEKDATLWFSSAKRYASDKSAHLKLFSSKLVAGEWATPVPFQYNKKGTDTCHPWLSADGETLFFSSNRSGGAGGMDIWYCVRFADGWSQPIWAGEAVNTAGNELFPTCHGGDLYFSSDGQPGAQNLDVFRADGAAHWRSLRPMPTGINSPFDDMQLVFIAEDMGYLSSNRGAENGDDIFEFELLDTQPETHGYTAWLQCKNTPVQGERVDVFDEEGTLVLTEVTSASGHLSIDQLHVGRPYSAKVKGLSPILASNTFLFVQNPEGVVVAIIPLDGDGFTFELLPGDNLAGSLMDNPDQSVLSIAVDGQLYDQIPGDIGRGQAVYIASPEGELLSLAYTGPSGNFMADDVLPLSHYIVSVDPDSRATQVLLNENGKTVVLPLQKGKALFQRLQDAEAIPLFDEHQRPIQVREDDVFIIKNIYYAFDKSDLNTVAQSQLRQPGRMARKQPHH